MASYYIVRSEPRYTTGSNGRMVVKYLYEFLVANSSVTGLPQDAYPGSKAYTADRSWDAVLDVDGSTWVNSYIAETYQSGEVNSNEV